MSKDIPKTGDESIDHIHKEEALLLEEVLEALKSGSDESVTNLFEKFITHMTKHFEHEEALMDEHEGYNFKTLHKGEHYKVLNDARYKLLNWQSSHDRWDLEDFLKYEFLPWLDQHIKAMDIVMVDFFKRG